MKTFSIVVVAMLATTALADDQPRDARKVAPVLHAEVGRTGSQVRFLTEGQTTIINVTSEFGIDKATITRKSDQWPKSLLVRLHLRGLESFQASNSDVAIQWSVSSTGDNPSRVSLQYTNSDAASAKKEKELDDKNAYFTKIRIVADKKKIPLSSGHFEVPLPRKLFADNAPELTLRWIDFYRN